MDTRKAKAAGETFSAGKPVPSYGSDTTNNVIIFFRDRAKDALRVISEVPSQPDPQQSSYQTTCFAYVRQRNCKILVSSPQTPSGTTLYVYSNSSTTRGLGFGVWGLGFGVWEIGRASCRERV